MNVGSMHSGPMFPLSSWSGCARTHRPWDERTQ